MMESINDKIRKAWLAGFRASEQGVTGELYTGDPDANILANPMIACKYDKYMDENIDLNMPIPEVEPQLPLTPFDIPKRGPGRPRNS